MDIQELLNPEDNGQQQRPKDSPLKSLEKDLKMYSESIQEVANDIIEAGLSAYPIFIAHQHTVSIGELILDRTELGTGWSVQASTLEEFIEKGVIHADRRESFIRNYKNPAEFMCLFVIVPEGANFVFYPFK